MQVCRKVGLTDVELFSPPDAVEGKDIRQVCTSIRSLARKARAQHIRVEIWGQLTKIDGKSIQCMNNEEVMFC